MAGILWRTRFVETVDGRPVIKEADYHGVSAHAVRLLLTDRGRHPIDIRPRKPPLLEWSGVRTDAWRIQMLQQLRFQLAFTTAEAGLTEIIAQEAEPLKRMALAPARNLLDGGGTFATSVAAIGLFDEPTMAILRIGEISGNMMNAVEQAIQHVEENRKAAHNIRKTAGLLAFDIISVIGSAFLVQWHYIPYLREQGVQTSDVAAKARFAHFLDIAALGNGALCILFTFAAALGAALWLAHKTRRSATAAAFLRGCLRRMPMIGTWLAHRSLADGMRMVSRLADGGVRLDSALTIAVSMASSPAVKDYWIEVSKAINGGTPLGTALARVPLTPPERSRLGSIGSIDQMCSSLASVAEERDRMAELARSKMLATAMGILVLTAVATIGVLVGLLMLASDGMQTGMQELLRK